MKSFLVNLLVILSIALCAFNGVQWYREAKLHGRISSLGNDIFQKSTEIQSLQLSLKVNQDEIKRIDGIRESFATLIRSNRLIISGLEDKAVKFEREVLLSSNKLAHAEKVRDQYKDAFDKANDNLKKQNEVIQKQNERMLDIANSQKEVVERYQKLATDYKALGDDYQKVLGMYTNLVAQVQQANTKK